MDTVQTKAFVMNVIPWKDKDRLLHLLTPDHGLITANARGSSGMKSRLRSLTQLFSYGDFTLFEKQGRYTVRSGALIEPFAEISLDLDRLTAAAHAAEAFTDVARNSEPQRSVFDLWGYAIYRISTAEDPVFTARLSTFRLMVEIGFAPCLDVCVRCHREAAEPLWFSFRAGGLLCERPECRHLEDGGLAVSPGTVRLLHYAAEAPLSRLFLFSASEAVREEASEFADRWLQEKMEKQYARLSLLERCVFERPERNSSAT